MENHWKFETELKNDSCIILCEIYLAKNECYKLS